LASGLEPNERNVREQLMAAYISVSPERITRTRVESSISVEVWPMDSPEWTRYSFTWISPYMEAAARSRPTSSWNTLWGFAN